MLCCWWRLLRSAVDTVRSIYYRMYNLRHMPRSSIQYILVPSANFKGRIKLHHKVFSQAVISIYCNRGPKCFISNEQNMKNIFSYIYLHPARTLATDKKIHHWGTAKVYFQYFFYPVCINLKKIQIQLQHLRSYNIQKKISL